MVVLVTNISLNIIFIYHSLLYMAAVIWQK